MKPIAALSLAAVLLAACVPASPTPGPVAASPGTELAPSNSALPTRTPPTNSSSPPAPTATAEPATSTLLPPGRLSLEEASEFLRTWYRQNLGPFEIDSIEETTPDPVWEQLGAQIFRIREAGLEHWASFLLFEEQVWPLDTGFFGQGIPSEDLLVADLEQDGQPELAIAFSYDGEVGQAMRLRVFYVEDGDPELLELDWASEGRLELALNAEGQVVVLTIALDGSESGSPAYLVLQGRTLALAADPALVEGLAIYESENLGISFQYPADWQPSDEGRFEGESGFFELAPYPSFASGITSAYHGLGFDLARACNWELNEDPARYGPQPVVQFADRGPSNSTCLVLPDEGALEPDPFLLFHAPTGGFGILKADPEHIQGMVESLRFHFPEGEPPRWSRPTSGGSHGVQVELESETRRFGGLTLLEHSLFSESEYSPNMEHLGREMPEVLAAHDDLRRSNPFYLDLAGRLDHYNAILEPSGYRLAFHGGVETTNLVLFRGEELVRGDLFIIALQLAVSPGGDFALLIEDMANHGWLLIRPGSIEPWDVEAHAYTGPAFAGERLVTVENERDERAYRLVVNVEGQPVYTFISAFREPLDVRLSGWGES